MMPYIILFCDEHDSVQIKFCILLAKNSLPQKDQPRNLVANLIEGAKWDFFLAEPQPALH